MKSGKPCEWKVEQANARVFADGVSAIANLIKCLGMFRSYSVIGARPRWWYIVATNCKRNKVNVEFRISFQNSGGLFEREFSKDAQGS